MLSVLSVGSSTCFFVITDHAKCIYQSSWSREQLRLREARRAFRKRVSRAPPNGEEEPRCHTRRFGKYRPRKCCGRVTSERPRPGEEGWWRFYWFRVDADMDHFPSFFSLFLRLFAGETGFVVCLVTVGFRFLRSCCCAILMCNFTSAGAGGTQGRHLSAFGSNWTRHGHHWATGLPKDNINCIRSKLQGHLKTAAVRSNDERRSSTATSMLGWVTNLFLYAYRKKRILAPDLSIAVLHPNGESLFKFGFL